MRETELYKRMNSYLACAYAEGFCEGEHATEEEQLIAWQWLYDMGTWRQLQGWYGRAIHSLLEQGLIK